MFWKAAFVLMATNSLGTGLHYACVEEGHGIFDLDEMEIRGKKYFKQHKIEECVNFCLRSFQFPFVMISYSKGWFRVKYNCACTSKKGFALNKKISDFRCNEYCGTKKQYRCGDEDENLWSVYCVKKGCQEDNQEPVCAKRMPHDDHGCIKGTVIDWNHAHNVRNFSAAENDHTACVWECKDNHPRSIFSLTRVVGSIMTCSCAYKMAFKPKKMILPEFCKMFSGDHDFYKVNCVDDLNENPHGGAIGKTCQTTDSVGCVYEDILTTIGNESRQHFSVDMPKSDLESVNVEVCIDGCVSMFSKPMFEYTAVHFDPDKKVLSCWCLDNKSVNQTIIGPKVDCNQNCGFKGQTSKCGGHRMAPAASLYCSRPRHADEGSNVVSDRMTRSVESKQGSYSGPNGYYLAELEGILRNIQDATTKQSTFSHIMVTLLSIICAIITIIVVYCCFSNGIMYLSKISA